MLPIFSNTDLQSNFSRVDFVLKTQQQLIKDFGSAGINFPNEFHSEPHPMAELLHAIESRLKQAESTNAQLFSQLLYQIDIPESVLSNLVQSDKFHLELAEIVLKREALKVFLREKFKSI
jgi:hypothetical protein